MVIRARAWATDSTAPENLGTEEAIVRECPRPHAAIMEVRLATGERDMVEVLAPGLHTIQEGTIP